MGTFYLPRPLLVAALGPLFWLAFNVRLPTRLQRVIIDLSAPLQRIPSGAVVRQTTLAGRPAERITVGATERRTAILYIHGGAFTVGSLSTHRSLAAHLARESGSVVYSLDYRLAPEHPFPAGLEDAMAAFMELVTEHGFESNQIAIAGDSAGGGLSVAAARLLIDRHGVHPAALALIAPWTDPSELGTGRQRDLVINTAWGADAAAKYLGGANKNDAGFAPLRGNLKGLPPTIIHVGTQEVLHPQVMDFAERLKAAGVEVTCTEFARLWHVAHAQASLSREAAEAVAEMGASLRTTFDSQMDIQPGARNIA